MIESMGPDENVQRACLPRRVRAGFFGELAVIPSQPQPYTRTVRARTTCRFYRLEKSALDELRKENPAINDHFNGFLGTNSKLKSVFGLHGNDEYGQLHDRMDTMQEQLSNVERLLGKLVRDGPVELTVV